MTVDKIEVVAPLRVSSSKIHQFVTFQQDWVVSAKEKITKQAQMIKKIAPIKFVDGAEVPFRGELIKLRFKYVNSSKKIRIELSNKTFMVYLSSEIAEASVSDLVKLALTDWMKCQVAKDVEAVVLIHAKKYNLYPRFIKIKTQKSRWGSCGIHDDINLNWLLILAPVKVLEYVVVHEICHIKERNHSARFWSLVEMHCPDYQEQRLWLKKNGQSLMQGL